MELSLLSDEELLTLKSEKTAEVSREHINQHARKILINALYGATGNIYFRYFDLRNARGTTVGGQLSTRWAERKLNEYLNKLFKNDKEKDYIIYGDTDSLYLCLEDFTDKFPNKNEEEIVDLLDKFCESKLQPVINTGYTELADYTNAYDQKMFMDREVIATRGFWTTKKKRYALWVKDNEGIRKDKLKIMGIETQRSSTPKAVVRALTECIKIILTKSEDDLQNYVDTFKKEFNDISYLELSGVSTANNMAKYSDKGHPIKGTPGHVKAALAYNRLAELHGFDKILEGEKVSLLNLELPNKYMCNKIAFVAGGVLPDEIKDYVLSKVDYNDSWDSLFLKPLNTICEAIKYQPETTFSIEDFM